MAQDREQHGSATPRAAWLFGMVKGVWQAGQMKATFCDFACFFCEDSFIPQACEQHTVPAFFGRNIVGHISHVRSGRAFSRRAAKSQVREQ